MLQESNSPSSRTGQSGRTSTRTCSGAVCARGDGPTMRNISDLLREKEAELQQLEKEVEALRLAVGLLDEKGSPVAAQAVVAVASPKIPDLALSFGEHDSGTS